MAEQQKSYRPRDWTDIDFNKKIPIVSLHGMSRTVNSVAWKDENINSIACASIPNIDTAFINRLGLCMIRMYSGEKPTRLSDIVTVLAANIRSPTNKRIINCEQLGNGDGVKDLADLIQNNTLEALENTLNIRINRVFQQKELANEKEAESITKEHAKRTATKIVRKNKWVNDVLAMPEEPRASFFCFFAAVLCRAGVKAKAALDRHLTGQVVKKFIALYAFDAGVLNIPPISEAAFNSLRMGLKHGTQKIRSVLKGYLKVRYGQRVPSYQIRGILDYTLLIHTSYFGMQMVSLTNTATNIMGKNAPSLLLKELTSNTTTHSIMQVLDYFDYYEGESAQDDGIYTPWCRMFDDNYWSTMSIKKHPILGPLLVAICEIEQPDIWNMMSLKVKDTIKNQIKNIIDLYFVDAHKNIIDA